MPHPIRTALLCSLVSLGVAASAAHHSFAAIYDLNKPVTVHGTIAQVRLTNPHSWFFLDVKNDNGEVQRWAFEAGTPSGMIRNGFKPDQIKTGDDVTITASTPGRRAEHGHAAKSSIRPTARRTACSAHKSSAKRSSVDAAATGELDDDTRNDEYALPRPQPLSLGSQPARSIRRPRKAAQRRARRRRPGRRRGWPTGIRIFRASGGAEATSAARRFPARWRAARRRRRTAATFTSLYKPRGRRASAKTLSDKDDPTLHCIPARSAR